MRNYHRKTLIKKEKWPLIDGWYWCPMDLVKKRIREEGDRLGSIKPTHPLWFQFFTWCRTQRSLESRLAHACPDGKIRAPHWVENYRSRGGEKLYGKCKNCGAKLSDGVKTIIIMTLDTENG